jgi:hypothetical protein
MRIAMAVYTVHEPSPKHDQLSPEPERFVFVRDGFSFWAFLFGPLWMLRHRMWLVFAGFVAVVVGLEFALRQLGLSADVGVLVALLLALLIGFEAGTLRRFTLARRKWTNIGVIVGDDLEAAERRFFDAWTRNDFRAPGRGDAYPRSTAASNMAALHRQAAEADVVGLFPHAGAPR